MSTHLTPEQLLDLAAGLLDPSAAAPLAGHAAACAACGAALEAHEREQALLKARLAPTPAPPGLEGRVVTRVRDASALRTRARRAAAAAVAAVALVAAGLRLRPTPPPGPQDVLVQAVETSEARALRALFGEVSK